MCCYCPTIVKDTISSLLYSEDKYTNRTYINGRKHYKSSYSYDYPHVISDDVYIVNVCTNVNMCI